MGRELEEQGRREGRRLAGAAAMLSQPIVAFLRRIEQITSAGGEPFADWDLRELSREARAAAELTAENYLVAMSREWNTAYWKHSARSARWNYRRARARAALRSVARRPACRTPRPRSRARRAARRGSTRAGPGSDDGSSEPGDGESVMAP